MADTDVTPHGLGTWGSRTAVVTGTAVKRAAADAKAQLFRAAAHMLEASPGDLEARDNKIYVKGSSQKSLGVGEVAGAIHYVKSLLPPEMEAGAVVGRGTYDTPTELTNKEGIGHFTVNYCNSCHIAVVDVDPDTGKVEVVDYGVAEDVGRAINPEFVKGQLQGGFAQGLGYGVGEDLIYDESGNCLNPSFMDYQIPTSWEVPMIDKIYEVEPIDPEVPDGQKGIGESALTNPAAAIANAVFDATGVQITSLPISPEKVFRAIRSKEIPAAAS